ncbi:hypothetical protein Scep_029165 [Stephania cephalantha]|uniref:C3H1-type domain-containing protein n=1 Tax=Stephania cephalantha TaxID=152367 RepID=A0AAP0HD99_9MAGN
MNRKNEICRHFQRGSCKFGDRCNYLHPIQQRQKPNNSPFGIDHGNQHHPSDSASQPRNQFKFLVLVTTYELTLRDIGWGDFLVPTTSRPGENKWNRFNPLAGANSTPARQSDNQGQVVDHKCTDPELCKRQIAEDFKNERPLWHLTCYAHWKYLPCDIVGDISYDELRLAAYVDAKQGLDFPSIIAKERSLLNSKLAEFDNLLRNPYLRSSNSVSNSPSPFSLVKVNEFIVGDQNKVPSVVSSFSQLGFSTNEGPNKRQVLLGYMKAFFIVVVIAVLSLHAVHVPASNFGDQRPFPISSSVDLGMNNLTAGSQALGVLGNNCHLPTSQTGLLEEGSIWLKKKWSPGEIPEDAPSDEVIALGAVTGS